ncbi:alpha/beta-hydrolase [Fragilariopsis cylindrus CCMP1102]|uniref:Alpha/beta-hydrolase n=1 Tax=Fragilariopsis cylindrus CCMP1102 TaxID=635003 RepID=A0A1E7FB18_9STRA|nr:alpha/beta-hydrolase [Fragilariopsis cylindrus CCMP1102]|eukprot:OEU15382.1 alpha/beta-hydrolase [Fragilariopsis cylindrus CCMP1102]
MPMEGEGDDNQLYPAVIIVPDWDGVDGPTGYEAERAVMMAKEGPYVAMVADIYGTEYTSVEEFDMKIKLSTKYRSDPDLFVGRIQAAINMLIDHPNVDTTQIFVAGYCLGGTGTIDYAFSNSTFEGVKAVVPIHGGLAPLRSIQSSDVEPYILILSGGVDDAHGNTTELEMHLDSTDATWEISRYSNAQHGFTKWGTAAYQEMADSRSWSSMMSLFRDLTAISDNTPTMTDDNDGEAMVVDGTDSSSESSSGKNDDEAMGQLASRSTFRTFCTEIESKNLRDYLMVMRRPRNQPTLSRIRVGHMD